MAVPSGGARLLKRVDMDRVLQHISPKRGFKLQSESSRGEVRQVYICFLFFAVLLFGFSGLTWLLITGWVLLLPSSLRCLPGSGAPPVRALRNSSRTERFSLAQSASSLQVCPIGIHSWAASTRQPRILLASGKSLEPGLECHGERKRLVWCGGETAIEGKAAPGGERCQKEALQHSIPGGHLLPSLLSLPLSGMRGAPGMERGGRSRRQPEATAAGGRWALTPCYPGSVCFVPSNRNQRKHFQQMGLCWVSCLAFRHRVWFLEVSAGGWRALCELALLAKSPGECRQRSCSQKSRQGACASLPALGFHGAHEAMGAHGQCSREKFHLWSALRAWIKSWNWVGKM
ncbi:uncharacterized protein [Aphelocoma coerulescens]|uniref:uncharacterized protein n=1 Tax=Aphelocoma coerulescens TaxID=39617 RepID=UPI003604890F